MTSWSAPASCSYTKVTLGVEDDNGVSKYAVPLTTVFSPPPGCRFPLEQLAATKCWPPSRYGVWEAGGFYSPGLCPSDYTLGCNATSGSPTSMLNGFRIDPDETAGICVPSNFICDHYDPTSILYAIPRTVSGSSYVPTAYSLPAFQIRWRNSDLPCLESLPGPGIPTSSTPSTPTTATISSSVPSTIPTWTDPATIGGGISPGTVAGVAIGALIGALVLALGAVYAMMRKKRRGLSAEGAEGSLPPFEDDDGAKELHGGESVNYSHGTKHGYRVQPYDIELSATPVVEDRREIDTRGTPSMDVQEMPGTAAFIQQESELPVGSLWPDQGVVSSAELSGRPTVKRKSLPAPSPLLQKPGESSSPGRMD